MKRALTCACMLLSAAMAAAGAQQQPQGPGVNPFAPVSWQPRAEPQPAAPAAAPAPAPQVQSAPPPPAPPTPPPLPFRYLGRYSAGKDTVFLLKGDAMLLAAAGDTLEGGWRVDSIAGPAIQFTYLPLQMKQSLPTGDAH